MLECLTSCLRNFLPFETQLNVLPSLPSLPRPSFFYLPISLFSLKFSHVSRVCINVLKVQRVRDLSVDFNKLE